MFAITCQFLSQRRGTEAMSLASKSKVIQAYKNVSITLLPNPRPGCGWVTSPDRSLVFFCIIRTFSVNAIIRNKRALSNDT